MNIRVTVIGVGSPHGDDQVGWRLVSELQGRGDLNARLRAASQPIELLQELGACEVLIVVDACQAGAAPGSAVVLEWSEEFEAYPRYQSSHLLDVMSTLRLASALGRQRPRIVLFGVQVAGSDPGQPLSPAVVAALPALAETLMATIECQRDLARRAIASREVTSLLNGRLTAG